MSRRRKIWLIAGAVIALGVITGIYIAGRIVAQRFDPYIREQAVKYLRDRFDSEVELASLRVSLPKLSRWRLVATKARGAIATVEGQGLSMRWKGRRDVPALFTMQKFNFTVDLGTVFASHKAVPHVTVDGVEITIPPAGERPPIDYSGAQPGQAAAVLIGQVYIKNAHLVILPKDKTKVPLRFRIHQLRLDSGGFGQAMKYIAQLTNAKPPGEIWSEGTFGPWTAEEPSDTPVKGQYRFEKANLGVFPAIAGILNSTGQFEGSLSKVHAHGEASVPDFRLAISGNRVPLTTKFEVIVDGTNGNTILKPVLATLGHTNFTTSGAVIKHEGQDRRAIELDVNMPNGDIRDLLRLATKGAPFMAGQVSLKTRINIPPLSGSVREKLRLAGRFEVAKGHFLRANIQDQLDNLSRRAQGQPQNEEIDEVFARMNGVFRLQNEVLAFSKLAFSVPGAKVDLAGEYHLPSDSIDFHGTIRLQARLSQTMTGWKRWALKPVDPFFAKKGAGTYAHIKVGGTARAPHFGLGR